MSGIKSERERGGEGGTEGKEGGREGERGVRERDMGRDGIGRKDERESGRVNSI